MRHDFITWAKTLDWTKICTISQSLDDLNDAQFRFLKGRFIELLVEQQSDGVLIFVGEKHKDFDCPQFKCSVELKTELSMKLYNKKGNLRKSFGVRLTNSMGTNNINLDHDSVCDWLIIIKSDGAVICDRDTVIACSKRHGDGYSVNLQPHQITELSGRVALGNKYNLNIRQKVDMLLYSLIDNLLKNKHV